MARKNEIVDSIVERLKVSGLTPQDVVSMSGGRIPITQAYDWFREWKLSVIAALLLECYMERGSGSAEIFSEPEPKKVKGKYGGKEVEFVPAKVSMESEPAPTGPDALFTPIDWSGVDKKKVARKIEKKIMDAITPESPSEDVTEKQKIPANPVKKQIPSAIEKGNSYDTSMNMKYKVVGNMIRFACDGHWWIIGSGAEEFYAGDRLVRMSEMKEL